MKLCGSPATAVMATKSREKPQKKATSTFRNLVAGEGRAKSSVVKKTRYEVRHVVTLKFGVCGADFEKREVFAVRVGHSAPLS